MKNIIILGAGAIGRGFLPWVLDLAKYELVFVDNDSRLVRLLQKRRKYTSYMVRGNKLVAKTVAVHKALHADQCSAKDFRGAAAVFMSVGPRNCMAAAKSLQGLKCPVILCENDPSSVEEVRAVTAYPKIYFAIPDVIASNTASPAHLKKDLLSLHTEDGTLFVDRRVGHIAGAVSFCDAEELKKQWTAKLYLHNTTHCIAAYLGALAGKTYLHEAMAVPAIRRIVDGAMHEMLTALKLRWEVPAKFLEWYAAKELRRFSNALLFDPVSRVAREPLRKLDPEGRLMGAAQMCLSLGFVPKNILTGIISAILFEDERDTDRHLAFLRKTLPAPVLLKYVLGLRKGEVLEVVLREHFSSIVRRLEGISGTRTQA